MPKAMLAYTRAAETIWNGEAPDDFRATAERILERPLTDAEYYGLTRVLWAYSFLLNHEHQAESFSEQKKASSGLLDAIENLLDAIAIADQLSMGSMVSSAIPYKWDELYNHGAEYDRNEAKIVAALAALFADPNSPELFSKEDYEQANEAAWAIVRQWRASGVLVRPSYPPDLIVLLREFRDAARLFDKGLRSGEEEPAVKGRAFMEFIGQLTEWMKASGLPAWASKSQIYGSSGKITYLAKAINELIPELREPDGRRAEKQMRRPDIADDSLAASILAAQAEYEARRPKRD